MADILFMLAAPRAVLTADQLTLKPASPLVTFYSTGSQTGVYKTGACSFCVEAMIKGSNQAYAADVVQQGPCDCWFAVLPHRAMLWLEGG